MHLAQELLTNVHCSGCSKSYAKETSLEDEEHRGWPLEVDNDQLRAIIKADPLITTQKVAQELSINHSTVIWHLKQIGKVKILSKWVPHELTENQKNGHSEVSSSLTLCTNKLFLDWIVMWDEKWITWQPVMTSSAVGPRSSSKALPKAKLAPKNRVMVTGGLLLVWSTTTFWFLEKSLHLRTMLSKSMRCTENCNAYSQHWSTEWAQFSVTKRNRMLHNQCFKSWTNWAMKFCLTAIFTWPLANWYHFFKHLNNFEGRENTSTTSRRQKMLPKSLSNPEEWIFMLQE